MIFWGVAFHTSVHILNCHRITQLHEMTSSAPTYHSAGGVDADVLSTNIGIHSAWTKADYVMLWWRHQYSNTNMGMKLKNKKMAR